MSKFVITIERKAMKLETIKKIVEEIRARDKKMTVEYEKKVTPNSRADQLSQIMDDLDSNKCDNRIAARRTAGLER